MANVLPISLCMIARDEEAFLDAALKSARSVLNIGEMVVADTGSVDRTKGIALENGAKVVDFEWCDDFSAARNFAADNAKNDWILMLDADEELISLDFEELKEFIKDANAVGAVTAVQMPGKSVSPLSRLYNKREYKYDGTIHEQIESLGNRKKHIKKAPIHVIHHGYADEVVKARGKLERNERLLRMELSKDPDDPYLLYQLGKSFFDGERDLYRACVNFERALSSAPDFRLEYIYSCVECYGYALINTGQYEKALRLMERCNKHYEVKPEFRFLTAHVLQNNGMFIEAVEYYESCIGADTVDYRGITSFLSYYNIGVVLECVGMQEDAIQVYKSCGDYEPALKRLGELGES